MVEISVFTNKENIPSFSDLKENLGNTFILWNQIKDYVLEKYPMAKQEWNFPGKSFGWSFRIKDTKRVIIYLLPRKMYFKVAFVFGEKAMIEIINSDISKEIIKELQAAKKYAEGRGIRIEVKNKEDLMDIKMLIDVKLSC